MAIGCATVFTLQSVGCGGSSDKDDDGEESGGEALKNKDCQTITDLCHHDDTGSGTPHECHELAHADNATTCAANLARCTAACPSGGN